MPNRRRVVSLYCICWGAVARYATLEFWCTVLVRVTGLYQQEMFDLGFAFRLLGHIL